MPMGISRICGIFYLDISSYNRKNFNLFYDSGHNASQAVFYNFNQKQIIMKKFAILIGLGLCFVACKNEKTEENTIMDQDSLLLDTPEPMPAVTDTMMYPEDTVNMNNDTIPAVE